MPSFIDVFCGAGGFTEGFKMAGWKHVCGIEIDKWAAATYAAHNHGDVIIKDARNVAKSDIDPFMNKYSVTTLDAIIASPPCTSFSRAGPRREGDERDQLYKEVLRLTELLSPKWVVVENVLGMLTKLDSKSGAKFAQLLIDDFRRIGYACEYRVLNAMQFDVPQNRKRVIFIASKDPNAIKFPVVRFVKPDEVPVRKYLALPYRVPERYFMSEKKIEYYRGREGFTRIINPARACHTIRATYLRSRGEHALVACKDGRIRMLTEKEVASIMGFDKQYKIVGSATQVYKQLGNSVAPPMAHAIARVLLEGLGRKPKHGAPRR